MSEVSGAHPAPFWFRISVPADARFLDPLADLAQRGAESAGCAPAASEAVARAVRVAVSDAVGGASAACRSGPIDVTLSSEGDRFRVQLSVANPTAREARPFSGMTGGVGGVDIAVSERDGAVICELSALIDGASAEGDKRSA